MALLGFVFLHRKCLVKRDLVTVQSYILRIKNMNVSGKMLHLKRFSVVVKSKMEVDVEYIISFLKTLPLRMAPYQEINKLNLRTNLKRILKKTSLNFVTDAVPYR